MHMYIGLFKLPHAGEIKSSDVNIIKSRCKNVTTLFNFNNFITLIFCFASF